MSMTNTWDLVKTIDSDDEGAQIDDSSSESEEEFQPLKNREEVKVKK